LIDAISAYKYLLDQGYQAENICFVGDSAGAGLATALLLFCRDTKEYPIPGCLALMSPYFDLTHSLPSWHLNKDTCYLPYGIFDMKYISDTRINLAVGHDSGICKLTQDLVNPLMSPAHAKPGDEICPILIQVGSNERVRDDSLYFYSHTLPDAQIQLEIYEGGVHVFQLFAPFDKFAHHSLQRLGKFINENLGNSNSLQRSAMLIRNVPPFVAEEFTDVEGVLEDGMQLLLDEHIWCQDDNSPLITSAQAQH
jgi:acetyl esterase/lipase